MDIMNDTPSDPLASATALPEISSKIDGAKTLALLDDRLKHNQVRFLKAIPVRFWPVRKIQLCCVGWETGEEFFLLIKDGCSCHLMFGR